MTSGPYFDEQAHRQEDVVYFSGDSSTWSWAGVIGDEHDMTDEEVNRYIEDVNPELFHNLHGMKFGSSDIPMTFKAVRDLRRFENSFAQARIQPRQNYSLSMFPLDRHDTSNTFHTTRMSIKAGVSKIPESLIHQAPLKQDCNMRSGETQSQLKLDGIEPSTVLAAAERLYPRLNPPEQIPASFFDKNVEQQNASNYPPKSKEALNIRALKQLEINETLAEVSKCERALEIARCNLLQLKNRTPSVDTSVLITRQPYMERPEDRYKKQGLTRYHRDKNRRLLRRNVGINNTTAPTSTAPKLPETPTYYCYCREPLDHREMVRCSKEWCPIGWFHLPCTGLERLPYLHEEFYCAYCSDNEGPIVTPNASANQLDDRSEVMESFIDSVGQCFLDHEIETEVVFGEELQSRCRTNAAGRFSIYEDHLESPETVVDPVTVAQWDLQLRDKIMRWKAVNELCIKEANRNFAAVQYCNEPCATKPTLADLENAGPDAGEDDQENSEPISSSSTVQASSSTEDLQDGAEHTTNLDHYMNSVYHPRRFGTNNHLQNVSGTYKPKEVQVVGPQTVSNHSSTAMISNVQDKSTLFNPTYSMQPTRTTPSNPSSKYNIDLRSLFGPQPSTITDTTLVRKKHSYPDLRVAADSFSRSNCSGFGRSISDLYPYPDLHSCDNPHTPNIARRIPVHRPTKPEKPWGTPINVAEYIPEVAAIVEPQSPSPAGKRKYAQITVEEDEGIHLDDAVLGYNGHGDEDAHAEANDSDEEAYYEGWGKQGTKNTITFNLQRGEEYQDDHKDENEEMEIDQEEVEEGESEGHTIVDNYTDEIDKHDEMAYQEGWREDRNHNVTTSSLGRDVLR